jgi:hypothetical protein
MTTLVSEGLFTQAANMKFFLWNQSDVKNNIFFHKGFDFAGQFGAGNQAWYCCS